jgi:hypothetical protein
MTKLNITRTEAFEGPAYHYCGDDGYPVGLIIPVLVAYGRDGSVWQLPNGIVRSYTDDGDQRVSPRFSLLRGQDIADQALARGYIETDHWVEASEEGIKEYCCGSYGFAG